MKNLLKKLGVMIASIMLAMTTFVMPSFGAADKAFTVEGIEQGATAEAYLLVTQNDRGELARASGLTKDDISKMDAPTVKEIQDLAVKAQGDDWDPVATKTVGSDGKAVFTDLNAGMYLVIIKNGANGVKVYNPIIMSVGYDASEAVVKEIGKGDLVSLGEGATAIAKVAEVPFNKVVDREATKNGDKNANRDNDSVQGDETGNIGTKKATDVKQDSGDTAGKNDTVWFRINSTIPAYADIYTNPTFTIYDSLSAGLTMGAKENIKVYVGNDTDPTGEGEGDAKNYTLTRTDNGFELAFSKAFIKAHGNTPIEVRYCATVDADCDENFDPETNTAYVKYSNAPGQTKDAEKITTYHYTFTINGQINGPNSGENREVVKVGVNDAGEQVFEESTWTTQEGWKPLGGATFNLYRADQMTGTEGQAGFAPASDAEAIRVAKSRASDGMLMDPSDSTKASLDRLDAGVYYLVEQSIDPNPDKYAVNTTPIKVEISAVINDLGTLESYKIIVGGVTAGDYKVEKADYEKNYDAATDTYSVDTGDIERNDVNVEIKKTWKYENGKVTEVTTDGFDEAADIRNSPIGTLPSTGGMGTILFTIGGIVLIGLAFLLLFGGRRRQHQK